MLRYRKVPRIFLIGLGCASFLCGLGVVHIGWRISGWFWLLVLVCLALFCIKRSVLFAVPAVVALGIISGVWRGTDMLTQLAGYNAFIGQKVTVIGRVADDSLYDAKGQLDLYLTDVRINGHVLPGKVRVKTLAPIEPKRGDGLQAVGKMYDGFGSYQASMYYADARVTNVTADPIGILRRHFAASVQTNIPEPQASLGLGFLLGVKSQLPAGLSDQLKVLSLTHIIVASGYNLTILVRVSRRFFARRSKFQTAIAGFGLMLGFVAVTGISPSMGRAALVTSLALWAWYFGRRVHPAVLLLVAAAVTAAANPLYLWHDVGWWLSFLSFAGVLLLAPLLQHRIFARPPKIIGQVTVETISAQLATLPLMLLVFGNLSLLALPANVLIVPLIPLAMLLTFVGGVAGIIAPALGGLASWPASQLLGFMTECMRLMSQLPGASLKVSITAVVMVCLYILIAALGGLLWRKIRFNYLVSSVVE